MRKWNEILVETCRYALKVYPDLQLQLPLSSKARGKTNLIQEDEFNPGTNSKAIKVEGKEFHVNVNYDANDTISNAIHILRQVPDQLKTTHAAIVFSEQS